MVTAPRMLSAAEFMAMPDDGDRHELVRGEVRVMPPPKGTHGKIEAILVEFIGQYLRDRALTLGWTYESGMQERERLVGFVASGEFGMQFTLPDDPEQIRGADVAYVPAEQVAAVEWADGAYFPTVPHLVIEVISGSDVAADVAEKVQDDLAGGARRVWCVDPKRGALYIHAVDGPTLVLRRGDTLRDDEILPGFALPLHWIF